MTMTAKPALWDRQLGQWDARSPCSQNMEIFDDFLSGMIAVLIQ